MGFLFGSASADRQFALEFLALMVGCGAIALTLNALCGVLGRSRR